MATANPAPTIPVALAWRTIDSPVGKLRLWASGAALVRIAFCESVRPGDGPQAAFGTSPTETGRHAVLDRAAGELAEYFLGTRERFHVPVAPAGSSFQHRVWDALRHIPYGRTVTYGQIAGQLGQPTASRAVGLANGRNPLPIVIPCHRVIGAGGQLTGFAGGLTVKRQLLALEGALPAERERAGRRRADRAAQRLLFAH